MFVSSILAVACPADVDLGFVHLDWFKLVVLGIVQGITELLPISSTAHLRIVPGLLGWPDPGSAFSAAMQLASLVAVLTYFWSDLRNLARGTYQAIAQSNYMSFSFRLTVGLLLGTVPIIIAGLLLKKVLNACNSPLRSLIVVGMASVAMSLLLALAEIYGKRKRDFKRLTPIDGILVGIAQAFALIPGVSRSGSTLTAGLFLGMERETAARFSFLLGLPAVVLAGIVELHLLFKAGLDFSGWLSLLIALTSASISAFIVIYGLLHFLERQSTWIFVWYRLLMGLFLIVGVAIGWFKA